METVRWLIISFNGSNRPKRAVHHPDDSTFSRGSWLAINDCRYMRFSIAYYRVAYQQLDDVIAHVCTACLYGTLNDVEVYERGCRLHALLYHVQLPTDLDTFTSPTAKSIASAPCQLHLLTQKLKQATLNSTRSTSSLLTSPLRILHHLRLGHRRVLSSISSHCWSILRYMLHHPLLQRLARQPSASILLQAAHFHSKLIHR